jgi:hypothetical protein
MPEPPPVRLVAVADVWLFAASGVETQLDSFYVMLLGFEREDIELRRPRPMIAMAPSRVERQGGSPQDSLAAPGPVYRAENFRLRFRTVEPPIFRASLRPFGIEVRSLGEAQAKLNDAEIEFSHERGLVPGQECLVLQDPAGNWLELTECRPTG